METLCNDVVRNQVTGLRIRDMQKQQHAEVTIREYGNSPKYASTGTRLNYETRPPTLLLTKPRAVVSQSTTCSFTVQAAGWFSVIEYQFVDYGLRVLGHRILVC